MSVLCRRPLNHSHPIPIQLLSHHVSQIHSRHHPHVILVHCPQQTVQHDGAADDEDGLWVAEVCLGELLAAVPVDVEEVGEEFVVGYEGLGLGLGVGLGSRGNMFEEGLGDCLAGKVGEVEEVDCWGGGCEGEFVDVVVEFLGEGLKVLAEGESGVFFVGGVVWHGGLWWVWRRHGVRLYRVRLRCDGRHRAPGVSGCLQRRRDWVGSGSLFIKRQTRLTKCLALHGLGTEHDALQAWLGMVLTPKRAAQHVQPAAHPIDIPSSLMLQIPEGLTTERNTRSARAISLTTKLEPNSLFPKVSIRPLESLICFSC
ncbi:hypothetical protein CERZMDRAFT_87303 [Cercospora zeae-maydis SCOH1-5]|uniref:Uncharacterized protein n=1 Tax=Cercospora zeae-maydis SCOH1-5 TaxID=717836 RepID=A0A6A6F512_9PEZI|nr:hypothetical protein CERZMDRAFT_87303 [Cercospora zeae-maydis SCOH1-5]